MQKPAKSVLCGNTGQCINDGVLQRFSGASTDPPQDGFQFGSYLSNYILLTKRGRVFPAPTDVVLSQQKVVQPDVLMLLNAHQERRKKQYIEGAPGLVVEIISPGTEAYDRLVKHRLYEESGVPEYWLVNPSDQSIEVFVLESGAYRSLGVFRGEQLVQSQIIPRATVSAAYFFNLGWGGE